MWKLSNTIQPKSKVLFVRKLWSKLVLWETKNISHERNLSAALLAVQEIFCPTKYTKAELVIYLIGRLKNIWNIFELMERIFISQHFCLEDETCYDSIKAKIKEFLLGVYKQVTIPEQREESATLFWSKLAVKEEKMLIAKTVKLYSWIVKG